MDILNQEVVAKLTTPVVECDEFLAPPPIRKTAPTAGFPKPEKSKVKIRVKKPKKDTGPKNVVDMAEEMGEGGAPDVPMSENAKRYDFEGNDITGKKASEETEVAGLHNHGDDPDKPGYALYELGLMCRSANVSQRCIAFTLINKIVEKNGKAVHTELQQMHIPTLSVSALFKPTNVSIRAAATNLILSLFAVKFDAPFALTPYPATPPSTPMILEYLSFCDDIVEAALTDDRLMDCLAMLSASKNFDISKLKDAKPSKHLFRLARAVFVNWGQKFAEEQAKEAVVGEDLELAEEAASLLNFFALPFELEFLDRMKPIVLATVLSRCEINEQHTKYIDSVMSCLPDDRALEFIGNCAQRKLISVEKAKQALDGASYGPAKIAIMDYCGIPLVPHDLPTTMEDCWKQRGIICGMTDYIIRTRDFKWLPNLLPCLYTFTNPAADMIMESVFKLPLSKERPLDPLEIFENLRTLEVSKVSDLLSVANFFPLRFTLPIFHRKDVSSLSDEISEFLDKLPDPLPTGAILPLDLTEFFDRFLYDCFFVKAFQKLAYFCVGPGADPEVRQNFWTQCSRYLSRFTVPNIRKDVLTWHEEDKEVIAMIISALKEQRDDTETDILKIAVAQVRSYLERHKGEHCGMVFFENARRLPECWAKKVLPC